MDTPTFKLNQMLGSKELSRMIKCFDRQSSVIVSLVGKAREVALLIYTQRLTKSSTTLYLIDFAKLLCKFFKKK